eukprot:TRINITY_DN65896_c12_g1_i2.p2 TRINITY_DN65896_c12_g1~~TRINITY_DN65896_c12_g1_i2.p2  ORF type:complete len:370 (+),score=150.14 TRINITY_DN65896_c12_g1_i2:391-1500(+)
MGACCCSMGRQLPPVNRQVVDSSHFEIYKVVGKGGFGKVNAVRARLTNETLAMKRLHKAGVANKSQFVKTVWRERDVLCAINRMAANFLVSSRFCFQDDTYLYVILEFMAGGDLRYYMSQHGAMKENVARFYIAELVLALEELHSLNLLYRDMKPDNVLLDEDGHLRLTDFGLAVPLKAKYNFRNRGFAGTPLYQAPEVLQNQWYSYPVDYWGLGIMIYELTQLRLPFRSDHDIVYQKHIRFKVPVSSSCVSIVNALLQQNPDQRLGSGPRGIDEIKSHPWFGGVDWSRMARKGYRPPFKPDVNRANCHPHLELEEQIINSSQDKTHRLSAEDQVCSILTESILLCPCMPTIFVLRSRTCSATLSTTLR